MAENYGQVVKVIGPSVDIRFPADRSYRVLPAQRFVLKETSRSLRNP